MFSQITLFFTNHKKRYERKQSNFFCIFLALSPYHKISNKQTLHIGSKYFVGVAKLCAKLEIYEMVNESRMFVIIE